MNSNDRIYPVPEPTDIRKQQLIEQLNGMIERCEPINYDEFNKTVRSKNIEELRAYEKKNPKVGLARYGTTREGISFLSMIATITDILTDDRLAFYVEKDRIIMGVVWYSSIQRKDEV